MESRRVSFKSAHSIVQSRRFCIDLGDSFTSQLQEYEPIYMARESVGSIVASSVNNKRKMEENDE